MTRCRYCRRRMPRRALVLCIRCRWSLNRAINRSQEVA